MVQGFSQDCSEDTGRGAVIWRSIQTWGICFKMACSQGCWQEGSVTNSRASPQSCLSVLTARHLAFLKVSTRRKLHSLLCFNVRHATVKERTISTPSPLLGREEPQDNSWCILKLPQECCPLHCTAFSLIHSKIPPNPSTKNPNTFHKQLDFF
jgi:hypothetical protein